MGAGTMVLRFRSGSGTLTALTFQAARKLRCTCGEGWEGYLRCT